ncbi:MAG: DUF4810 domain-containing protein [Bacteroidota bacterium]
MNLLLTRRPAVLLLACGALLSGCAARHEPLYYWGDYQPQVYGYFTGDKSPEDQIQALEAGIEKARASGKPLAPGYQAQLGMLYAKTGREDQTRHYFEAEKAQFPEGRPFMDFLLRNFKTPGAN